MSDTYDQSIAALQAFEAQQDADREAEQAARPHRLIREAINRGALSEAFRQDPETRLCATMLDRLAVGLVDGLRTVGIDQDEAEEATVVALVHALPSREEVEQRAAERAALIERLNSEPFPRLGTEPTW